MQISQTSRQSGNKYKAMLNIGNRPTVSNSEDVTIEVFLIDFEGDLYGQILNVKFVKRIRDAKKFENFEELKSALKSDEIVTRNILSS